MAFSDNPIEFQFKLNNVNLNNVKHHKDLGIIFDHNLNFEKHINNIITRAKRIYILLSKNVKIS